MLESFKVHSERVESIAKSLKDLSHSPGTSVAQGKILPGPGSQHPIRYQKAAGIIASRTYSLGAGTCNARSSPEPRPGTDCPEPEGHSMPAIRCFRCGDEFPVTDFLYTKKSGLCIPCWEKRWYNMSMKKKKNAVKKTGPAPAGNPAVSRPPVKTRDRPAKTPRPVPVPATLSFSTLLDRTRALLRPAQKVGA